MQTQEVKMALEQLKIMGKVNSRMQRMIAIQCLVDQKWEEFMEEVAPNLSFRKGPSK